MGGAASVQDFVQSLSVPIRLIDFAKIQTRKEMPRFPENSDICVEFGHDSVDWGDTFIVFISHCWLRGWNGAEGYDGRPHPDNAAHEKFWICVAGIEKLWKAQAPGCSRCFIWLDFGCKLYIGLRVTYYFLSVIKLFYTCRYRSKRRSSRRIETVRSNSKNL